MLVAAAFRAGRSGANEAFDRFLPQELREVAAQYWTPLPVVRRAALWLRETEVRTVVDVGSGAGKFCVAAALMARCRFIGVEQRGSLIDAARALAETMGVADRVTFAHGGIDTVATLDADAYYIFNPFGEYTFRSPEFTDAGITFTPETHRYDLAALTALLNNAPAGTFAITYNGLGATFPADYEQIDTVTRLPGTLRLWKKR